MIACHAVTLLFSIVVGVSLMVPVSSVPFPSIFLVAVLCLRYVYVIYYQHYVFLPDNACVLLVVLLVFTIF